jgi:hypothetical protein
MTTALAERIVKTFNMVGFFSVFANRSMAFGRQDSRISPPEIGVTNGTLPIDRRHRVYRVPQCGNQLSAGFLRQWLTTPMVVSLSADK